MARAEKITCDVCSTAKAESHAWISAFVEKDDPRAISFAPAGEYEPEEGQAREDICSVNCALVRLSRALTSTKHVTQEAQ